MVRVSFAVTLFTALLPASVQGAPGAPDFVLSVCNGGKIAIDAFAVVDAPPAVVHIAPDLCETVYLRKSNDPAVVGFAFDDAQGRWGAPHRYDYMPRLAAGVLARTNQNVSVRRGNQTVTTTAQFSFRSQGPVCHEELDTDPGYFARNPKADPALAPHKTVCEGRHYEMIVAAYADTHELSFLSDCERCPTVSALSREEQEADASRQLLESARTGRQATPRKRPNFTPYLQYWPEFYVALAAAGSSGGMPPGVPRVITVRGTVSRIVEAPPNAFEHWIDIFFKEASDGRFDVCSLGPEIFSEVYGPDFRTSLIGQVIEVEGEIERAYCKGFKGNIRIALARQVRRSDAAQLAATMIAPARPAPKVTPARATPYHDPDMPNYDISEQTVAMKVEQYCTGLYDPVMKTEQQNQVRAANTAAVKQEVETCKSHFDLQQTREQRRLAMRYCLGHNNFTDRNRGMQPTAYDSCMEKYDALTRLCYLELNFRQRSYAVSPRTVEQHCVDVRPYPAEAAVILRGGTRENGAAGVIPTDPPALPAVLQAPMDPGIIQRLAPPPAAASPATTAAPRAQPSTLITQPARRRTPEEQRQAAQDAAACRQRAARDYPNGGESLTNALQACAAILQQK